MKNLKYYLADTLTLIRFILAFIPIALTFIPNSSLAAVFLIFVIGELTDALDGTLATKFPFPKNKAPKYRQYASLYDMLADALLAAAMALFFIIRISPTIGLTVAVIYAIAAIVIDLVIYGRLFGHPDTARPGSLALKNFKLAKKIILARRFTYVGLIIAAAFTTLFLSEWPLAAKITITIIAIFVGLGLLKFIGQRTRHISRDAVDIEKKLENK